MHNIIVIKAVIEIEKRKHFSEEDIRNVLYNGASYGCIYSLDKIFEKKPIKEVAHYVYCALKNNYSSVIYAQKKDVFIKIIIESGSDGDCIMIESTEQAKLFDEEKKSADLGFYVQCCVELCEDFIIYELKSEQ